MEDAVKRLKESGYLDFTQHPSPNNKEYKYNQYTFPLLKDDMVKDGFLMLKPKVLTLPLKPKERGILIYLQLIALPNMNDIVETKIEDIANRIGICRQTASKYLKQFITSGYLHQSRNGIYPLALRKHVDSEDKGVAKCDTLGGAQKITLTELSQVCSLELCSLRLFYEPAVIQSPSGA